MKLTRSIFSILLIVTIFSCTGKGVPSLPGYGNLISSIQIHIKAEKEDADLFEEGKIPWINLEKPQLEKLYDADEIVLTSTKVTLVIDYPLAKPATFELTSKSGFTRKQLIIEISKKYAEIYNAEEISAKTKTIPSEKRAGVINRNETDGKYGICCHDLSDLDLSVIEVYKNGDSRYLILGVES